MSGINEDYIKSANEWQIRSLISRVEWPVVGDFSDILSTEALAERHPKEQHRKFTSHPIIGEMLRSNQARVRLSITDMCARQQSDLDLIGDDVVLELSWLRIPSDKDKYFIVLIIRKFLDYQSYVHSNNLTSPTAAERADYRILKQLHNYLIDDGEDWINRGSYQPIDKLEPNDISSLLNAGGKAVSYGEGETRAVKLARYDEGSSFASLTDTTSKW